MAGLWRPTTNCVPSEGGRRGLGRLIWWLGPLAAAGCSTWVDVRPLATGRADVEAYELRGPELALLRREVLRRCPQGAEIVRQAARDQQAAAENGGSVGGSIGGWMSHAAAWVDPPNREAQMVVLCKPNLQGVALALPRVADEATPSEPTTPAATADKYSTVLPIGPITPEW